MTLFTVERQELLQLTILFGCLVVVITYAIAYAEQQPYDYFAPISNHTIIGNYNDKTNWYYGSAPTATITATDDLSGVKYITVWYRGCSRGECIFPDTGGSISLNRQTSYKEGLVHFEYFATDNAMHVEQSKLVSIMYDGLLPSLYFRKISTESIDSIPIGSSCKDFTDPDRGNCVLIKALKGEKITFEFMASDSLSHIATSYYTITTGLNNNTSWIPIKHTIPDFLYLRMNQTGIYRLNIKTIDFAGNESPIKQFWLKINPNPTSKIEPSPIEPIQNETHTIPPINDTLIEEPKIPYEDRWNSVKIDYFSVEKDNENYNIALQIKSNTTTKAQIFLMIQHRGYPYDSKINNVRITDDFSYTYNYKWMPKLRGDYILRIYIWDHENTPLVHYVGHAFSKQSGR